MEIFIGTIIKLEKENVEISFDNRIHVFHADSLGFFPHEGYDIEILVYKKYLNK